MSGFGDNAFGNIEDGGIFKMDDAAVRTRLDVEVELGGDGAVAGSARAKIISYHFLINVQLFGNAFYATIWELVLDVS